MSEYHRVQPFKIGNKVKFDWDLNEKLKSYFEFNGGKLDEIYTVNGVHKLFGVPHISLSEISGSFMPSWHFVLMSKPVGFLITDD